MKYILKRVITGVLLFVVISCIKSCEVHAETRNVFDIGSTMKQYPSNNTQTFKFNQWYTLPSGQSGYSITFNLDTNGQDHFEAGQYLFDFYIETNNLTNHLASCTGITTDFQLFDLTSNSWISSSNQSKSQCLDSYYTTIGGNRTIHYLFSWTTNNGSVYDILFTRMKFIINNFTGQGFIDYGGSYMIIMGTVQDYDPQVVQNFTNVAEQQRLNQQSILNATQNANNIINNQTQNTQDILNSQSIINQNINNIGQDTSTIIQQNNDMKNTITNDNIDSADSKASEWASKNLSDNAVANMVTMPITLLQAYLNGLNGSCSSFSLGTLYDHELTLPCINLSSYFGSTLWGVIDILFSGFMIYALGKKFVKIFNDFTNLKDNQVDELYGGGN